MHPVGSYCENISRCMVHKTLNKKTLPQCRHKCMDERFGMSGVYLVGLCSEVFVTSQKHDSPLTQ